jgi:hypothetical protein
MLRPSHPHCPMEVSNRQKRAGSNQDLCNASRRGRTYDLAPPLCFLGSVVSHSTDRLREKNGGNSTHCKGDASP